MEVSRTRGFLVLAALGVGTMLAVSTASFATPPADDQAGKVTPDMVQTGSDIPAHWKQPEADFDYVKREVMIPMRDGVKLHTAIFTPKHARKLPILLNRTPYNANDGSSNSPHLADAVWSAWRDWADGSFILVFQDVRGKFGSQGKYVMTRPPRGPLNPTKTDDTTDAWDTIAWLVKHLEQSNGKVGMFGSSYDGWTVVMALLDPHPALEVAVVASPMIDGWMGDDWYHYGAFRQGNMLDFLPLMMTEQGFGKDLPRESHDDYTNYLRAGSAGAYAVAHGFAQLPWWKRFAAHPAYDAFWQLQAMDKLVAKHPSSVPTMWLQGMWDNEDIYGAVHSWEELKKAGHAANNHLVIGPWWHSQIHRDGWHTGPLKWPGDTTAQFRQKVMNPWFNHYLRGTPRAKPLPEAMIYNPVAKRWNCFHDWKVASDQKLTPIYLQESFGLGFQAPRGGSDSYVSDPAKPVPYMPRPIVAGDKDRWRTWLVHDQRFAESRPDVLSYVTPVLKRTVTIRGAPIADLFAKTTGTDGDFVVKLIDVYPGTVPSDPEMGGYELPVALDIFRGRYRESFSKPSPIPANQVQEYRFRLPTVNYEFRPGHRIMVQIQSSLFPLYDRNPQSWVPNILFAKPSDYRKATITIEHGKAGRSAVLLPVVEGSTASH